MAKEYRYIKNKINNKVVDVNVDFFNSIYVYRSLYLWLYLYYVYINININVQLL